jgi:hypothetical protein
LLYRPSIPPTQLRDDQGRVACAGRTAERRSVMSTWLRLFAALAATASTAVVLAMVRSGWLDAADGVVLVVSLAVLARTVIRLASDPSRTRRRQR